MYFSQAHMIQYTQSLFKPFYGNQVYSLLLLVCLAPCVISNGQEEQSRECELWIGEKNVSGNETVLFGNA